MNATRRLLQQQRTPMIQFLGKRTTPTNIDHTPVAHPASPTGTLPPNWNSFAYYRQKAQQHGPLTTHGATVGTTAGSSFGSVDPTKGEFFDRSELPARFGRLRFSQDEIDAVESGGASLFA